MGTKILTSQFQFCFHFSIFSFFVNYDLMLIDNKFVQRMEDIERTVESPEDETNASNCEVRGSATFLVVDDLELVRSELVQLKQSVKEAVETIQDLKERIESMEDRMGSLYQQLDCYRALALFVIPAVFAYIFEAMFTPEVAPIYGPRHAAYGVEPKTLFLIFRGLCLCFSMCVGLPALLEEVLASFHQYRVAANSHSADKTKEGDIPAHTSDDEGSSEGSDVTGYTVSSSSEQSEEESDKDNTETDAQ